MSDNLSAFEQAYPVVIDMPVQWGDMDAFQHVNNVTYFRYFESVRIAYMGRTSLFEMIKSEGVFPVLVATECRYKRALNFPDTLKLGCRTEELQEHGFVQHYAVYSCTQDAVTTLGTGRIVLLRQSDAQQVPVSEALRAEITALEQGRIQGK